MAFVQKDLFQLIFFRIILPALTIQHRNIPVSSNYPTFPLHLWRMPFLIRFVQFHIVVCGSNWLLPGLSNNYLYYLVVVLVRWIYLLGETLPFLVLLSGICCDSSDLQLAVAFQQQEFEQHQQRNSQQPTVGCGSRLVTGPQVGFQLSIHFVHFNMVLDLCKSKPWIFLIEGMVWYWTTRLTLILPVTWADIQNHINIQKLMALCKYQGGTCPRSLPSQIQNYQRIGVL